jgi:hypothetical protein
MMHWLKFNISFNLRHTIVGFVVKCSAAHSAFVPCSLHTSVHVQVKLFA